MSNSLKIYLSGSIKKGHTDNRAPDLFWTDKEELTIKSALGSDVEILNPARTDIVRNDYFANYGCDLYLIKVADVVFVDLRAEKGIGVGAELMFAQFIGRVVIGWLPKNSYYCRDVVENVFGEDLVDWIHPFAFGLCDYLAESLNEACDIADRLATGGGFRKPIGRSPDEAMQYFLKLYPEFGTTDEIDT